MITGATICASPLPVLTASATCRKKPKSRARDPACDFPDRADRRHDLIFATYFLQLYFPDISRFKDPMRHSLKSCCTLRVKRSRLAPDLLHHYRTGVRYGGARRRSRLMYVMGRDGVFPKSFFGYVTRNGVLRR